MLRHFCDQQGRLLDLANKKSEGTVLSDFSSPATGGYDGVGNRLSMTATVTGCPTYSGTTHYQYDYGQSVNPALNRSQLSQATSTTATGTENYLYDQTGHGQPASSTGPGNATSFFEGADQFYNADNLVTNTPYTYDGNGNPIKCHNYALTFDPESRMTSYGSLQTDGWNGDGLRAWKQTGAASTRTYFLYDGTTPVGEYGSTGTRKATNVFGADGLISRLDPSSPVNTGWTFYSYDLRGSVTERLYANGNSYQVDLYFANGYRSERLLDYSDPWGYGAQAGYYTDLETGLILCTHRFYDTNTGRFVTRDPMGYAGGINLYAYTRNNPVNGSDPSGYYEGSGGDDPDQHPGDGSGNSENPTSQTSESNPNSGSGLPEPPNPSPIPAGPSGGGGAGGGMAKAPFNFFAKPPAAATVPDQTGNSEGDFKNDLGGDGFKPANPPSDGPWDRYAHGDGSLICRNTKTGRVTREGPERPSPATPNPVRTRYGPDGNVIPWVPGANTHNTGENTQLW